MSDPRVGALLRLGQQNQHADSPLWGRIMAETFPKQREFVLSGDIGKAGRGSGKSNGHARKYHRRSHLYPGKNSVFIALSAERARDILVPALEQMSHKYGLGLREYRKANAMIWPNGYRVLMRGCKDRIECNKRRGVPWVEAGWDECQDIASGLLEYDIHECVEPRLVDFNGNWAATGTPSAIPKGYWHQLSTGGTEHPYRVVEWDARENPHMPNVLAYFLKALKKMGGVAPREKWPAGIADVVQIIGDPKLWHLLPAKFVREYLGKWVLDLEALIYRLTPRNNYSGDIPFEITRTTIGLDLGGAGVEGPKAKLDRTAIAVCQSTESLPTIWVPEAFTMLDVTTETIVQRLAELLERYPDAVIHIDQASAGTIILDTYAKMGLPIRGAIKGEKLRRIQLIQSAIYHGQIRFHIKNTMELRHEYIALVWDDTRTKHHERCADDVSDALLMAAVPHFGDAEEQEQQKHAPKPGSAEANAALEAEELEQAYQEAMDQIDQEAA